jgi:hypothetical protein
MHISYLIEIGLYHCFFLNIESTKIRYLLVASSRILASISLLGGYFGKLDGSQGKGSDVKNCQKNGEKFKMENHNITCLTVSID